MPNVFEPQTGTSIESSLFRQQERFDALHQKAARADQLAVSKLHHRNRERSTRAQQLLTKLFTRLDAGLTTRYREAEKRHLDATNDLEFATAQLAEMESGRANATDLRAYFQHRAELEAQQFLLREVVAATGPPYERVRHELKDALRKLAIRDKQAYHESRVALNERLRAEKNEHGADWMALQEACNWAESLPLDKLFAIAEVDQ